MASRLRKAWLINPDSPVTGLLPERLLACRGILTPDETAAFLNPAMNQLHDPFLLPDMAKACALIERILQAGGKILVHGDYDVDGITATAVLVRFLRRLDLRVETLIPDRLTDGYGLTAASVAAIIASGCDLLITVDCGISSIDEVVQINLAGIPVIITDHHTCKEQLPAAEAVINPRRLDSQYPFTGLAGVGVAFKLIQALNQHLNLAPSELEHLDLVALGTVADVVPLVDENRAIVRLGLNQLNRIGPGPAPTCGLSALLGLNPAGDKIHTARTLGYSVAPRINASGRLGSADDALHLLLVDESAEAEGFARKLTESNLQRQAIETAVTAEAMEEIDRSFDFDKPDFIVALRPDWHPGVIGIAASRLADHYNRPVIMLTGDDGQYRGSCRSYGSINILDALDHAADSLVRYGGHPKAAGLTLDPEQLDRFRAALSDYAASHVRPDMLQPVLPFDLFATAEDLTLENARAIGQMEPFGEGNPVPLMVIRGLALRECRTVGNNSRHLKLSLIDPMGGGAFDGIAFGLGSAAESLTAGDLIDVCFSLEINEWQGRQRIQLNIADLHPADTGDEFLDEPWIAEHLYQSGSDIQTLADRYQKKRQHFQPAQQDYKTVYQYLKATVGEDPSWFDLSAMAASISKRTGTSMNTFRLSRILAVFHETGLVSRQQVGNSQIRLRLLPVEHKVQLDQSSTYQRLLLETEGGIRP